MQKHLEKFAAIATKNRRILVFALPLVMLFSVFLPISAQAWWNPFSFIDDVLTNAIVAIVTFVPASIFFIVAGLVNWIIGIITTIGIIPGAEGTPPFVQVGWEFSRNLINALFVIILVFIGLATILRLQTYQLQKTLPGLIIIALLVNFSAVLVGFVVDISNIIANIFLDATGSIRFSVFQTIFSTGKHAIDGFNFVQGIVYAFVLAIFYLISALVFFILFLLFFVRTIILWLLVVLAPLAFGAYVLPGTKKYWTQWLSQLVQWSIIGIPIGFFLYLSNFILNLGGGVIAMSPDHLTGDVGFLGGLISSILSPIVGIMVLFVGIMLSMQLAPAGAQGVINMGKKAGMKAGGWAAREGWRNFVRGKALEKLGANIRKRGQGIEVKPEDRTLFEKSKVGSGVMKLLGSNALARFGARTIGSGVEIGSKELNTRIKTRDENKIAQGEKEVGKDKGMGIKNLREETIKPILRDNSHMVGWLTGEIKNGNTKGVKKAIRDGEIKHDLIKKLYKNTVTNGNDDARELLEKVFPELAFDDKKDAKGNIIPESNTLGVTLKNQKDIMKNYSDKDVTDKVLTADTLAQHDAKTGEVQKDPTSGNILFDDELTKRFLQEGNRRLFQKILEKGDKEETLSLWEYIKSLGYAELMRLGREDIIKWSSGTAARNLGIDEIPSPPTTGGPAGGGPTPGPATPPGGGTPPPPSTPPPGYSPGPGGLVIPTHLTLPPTTPPPPTTTPPGGGGTAGPTLPPPPPPAPAAPPSVVGKESWQMTWDEWQAIPPTQRGQYAKPWLPDPSDPGFHTLSVTRAIQAGETIPQTVIDSFGPRGQMLSPREQIESALTTYPKGSRLQLEAARRQARMTSQGQPPPAPAVPTAAASGAPPPATQAPAPVPTPTPTPTPTSTSTGPGPAAGAAGQMTPPSTPKRGSIKKRLKRK